MEPYIGEIMLWPGERIPKGWLLCDGKAYDSKYYKSLFIVIGTTYGGSGSSFNVPDLRGRTPVMGKPEDLGKKGGSSTITLTPNSLPDHAHPLNIDIEINSIEVKAKLHAYSEAGNLNSPKDNLVANTGTDKMYASSGAKSKMSTEAIVIDNALIQFTDVADIQTGTVGDSTPQPIHILPQYLAMNFIIAHSGRFENE